MTKPNYFLLFVLLFSVFASEQACGREEEPPCPDAKIYENHNQIDYGPLNLAVIQGWGEVGGYDGSPGVPANGACISLFSETKHEWIKTIVADAEGKFRFESVKPGRYRLIARAPSQCPANIPIVVIKPTSKAVLEP